MSQDHVQPSSTLPNRILHLGVGSFHRAHQAVYLQRLLDSGDTRWTLWGANLRDDMRDVMDALQQNGGQYTLETVSPDGVAAYQRIAAISHVLPWQANLQHVVQAGSDAATRIISFTVTEAGYYLTPDDQLDLQSLDIQTDLRRFMAGQVGQTIYGALAAILQQRRMQSAGAVTLMCCDNLRHNGDRFQRGLHQFLAACGDAALLSWMQTHTSCPNAMVDRITPRPTPAVRERVLAATGVDDAAALMAEDFIQWVIEDNFIAGRPAFEHVGVEMVHDVSPYEEAKIRILNASHSCIAWAGTLLGYQYIHEGTHDAAVRQLAHDYVTQDVIPSLKGNPLDLPKYRDTVLSRFGNAAIADTNQRVAMDGYSKIPGFIAPTIEDCIRAGRSFAATAVLPALFLAFLRRWDKGQIAFVYQDQAMNAQEARSICAAADPAFALAQSKQLWGELAGQAVLVDTLRTASQRVEAFLAERGGS